MWKSTSFKEYYISLIEKNRQYDVFVTNFISLWGSTYSEKYFINQIKNSNEGLTLRNDEQYLMKALDLMRMDFKQLKKINIKEETDKLIIDLKQFIEFPFSFKCTLSKCSNDCFFEKVTQPMLKTVFELKQGDDQLIKLLKNKDKEIKAYKRELENRKIIFPHEETRLFNETDHKNMFPAYFETFGSSNIPDSIINKPSLTLNTQTYQPLTTTSIKHEDSNNTRDKVIKKETKAEIIKKEHESIVQTIKQESDNITQQSDNIKREPDSKTQQPHNIKQETDSIEEESNNLIEEQNSMKPELNETKTLSQPTSSKQENIAPESSHRKNNRSKRFKLSY